jgi:hypothetical protein
MPAELPPGETRTPVPPQGSQPRGGPILRRSSRIRDLQARAAKSVTVPTRGTSSGAKLRIDSHAKRLARPPARRKSQLVAKSQVHHHSPVTCDRKSGCDSSNFDCSITNFKHLSSNASPLPKRDRKRQLNLPPPSSAVWRQVDKDLSKVLPSSFSFAHIQSQSSEALILEFDDFLYEFFSSRFPWDDSKCVAHDARHRHADQKMCRMRALKRQARKAYLYIIDSSHND